MRSSGDSSELRRSRRDEGPELRPQRQDRLDHRVEPGGIGLAFAEGLAGAEVVINSNEPEELEAARSRLVEAGANAHAIPFDVTGRAAMEAAVEHVESEIGPIDILVANAGIQRRMPFVEFDANAYRAVMAINLDHIFFIGQAAARRMIPRGRGKIINTCSLNNEIGRQTIVPYTASNGAVKMLTKGMCVELARHGIQVNGIGPGYISPRNHPASSMAR